MIDISSTRRFLRLDDCLHHNHHHQEQLKIISNTPGWIDLHPSRMGIRYTEVGSMSAWPIYLPLDPSHFIIPLGLPVLSTLSIQCFLSFHGLLIFVT